MLIDECVLYFKENKGFKRVFEAFKKKYLSLGAVGGIVVIQKLTADEKSALSGLLRKDFSKNGSASIKMQDFQKALEHTKFRDLKLEDILKLYFNDELLSNSLKQTAYLCNRESFFNSFIARFEHTAGAEWLEKAIKSKKLGYNSLIQRYDTDLQNLEYNLYHICTALKNLPVFQKSRIRLPVFASEITSNPHAFDAGTGCGELFIQALSSYYCIDKPETSLERSELLYKAGILIDDVSNNVLCSGLKAFDSNGVHSGWEGFLNNNEVFLVALTNISNLVKIDSPYKMVFVVENPSVFMSIRDRLADFTFCPNKDNKERATVNIPIICGYGQINMAAIALINLLAENGVHIYYSGDFDPEGLLIADKLKKRYGEKLTLWRYSPIDYNKAVSKNTASETRLKQLCNISSDELKQIAQLIADKGLCGYQEQLIDDLCGDVKTKIKACFK